MFDGVPQRRSPHPIVNKGKKGLFDKELGIKDDQFGRGGNEVVTPVEFEELDKDLTFILLYKDKVFIRP